MQTGVVVGDSAITGTLHHVTGYTGFDGTNPAEQTGNYLALKVTPGSTVGVTAAAELVGGTKGPVNLDGDWNVVFHISSKDSESVKITVSKGGESIEKTYTLTGLTCESS